MYVYIYTIMYYQYNSLKSSQKNLKARGRVPRTFRIWALANQRSMSSMA